VGADAAAVALSEAPGAQTELTLVVDVGTNAEILLGDTEGVLACSSPTGPAFEGAQISSGQRAAPGAIERVEIDPDTKEPRFKVIGSDLWSTDPGFAEATKDTGVTGICGSGIIEAVAEMRMAGLSRRLGPHRQRRGHRHRPAASPRAAPMPTCCMTPRRGRAAHPRDQGDIRAIQLAKSALYAGARLLMDKRGADRVDRVVLAGAFGAHISPKHAMVLGMIPDARWTRSPAPATPRARRAHGAVQPRRAGGDREDRAPDREDRDRRRAPVPGAFRQRQRDPPRGRSLPGACQGRPLPAVSFGAGDRARDNAASRVS
jgi:uncharacterized 2Fe-2S/4Fe-4S cluster protein (DUF4445 family)